VGRFSTATLQMRCLDTGILLQLIMGVIGKISFIPMFQRENKETAVSGSGWFDGIGISGGAGVAGLS